MSQHAQCPKTLFATTYVDLLGWHRSTRKEGFSALSLVRIVTVSHRSVPTRPYAFLQRRFMFAFCSRVRSLNRILQQISLHVEPI